MRRIGATVPLSLSCLACLLGWGLLAGPTSAQSPPASSLEVRVLPAVNFDSDEGFGYGVLAELYSYGAGGVEPYLWTVQPTAFLTSKGRRDLMLFFDSPHLLPGGWRVTGFVGSEKQVATPYYGLGNETVYDEALDAEDGPNPRYYRFGRTRNSASFSLQRSLGDTPVRFLFGAGVERTKVVPIPEETGTTLFATEFGPDEGSLWSNHVRAGLVYDTRDRETGARSGSWTDVLVQWVDESLGADFGATRWTFTDRRYVPLGSRLVFAHRYLLQDVSAGAPAYELFRVETSFKQQEGLGGAKTVRGLPKNRFVGRGLLVWNAELRWRVADFSVAGRDMHAVLSAFLDQGRVWRDGIQVDELLSDLHRGYGGGVRVGMGENFVVALDVGTSSGGGMPFYLGLGYLY